MHQEHKNISVSYCFAKWNVSTPQPLNFQTSNIMHCNIPSSQREGTQTYAVLQCHVCRCHFCLAALVEQMKQQGYSYFPMCSVLFSRSVLAAKQNQNKSVFTILSHSILFRLLFKHTAILFCFKINKLRLFYQQKGL